MAGEIVADARTGRNGRHALVDIGRCSFRSSEVLA
jgi:hypothetical protein